MNLLIIGFGGHSRSVADTARMLGHVPQFVDVTANPESGVLSEDEVFRNPKQYSTANYAFINGIGEVGKIGKRKRIIERYQGLFASQFISLIHPRAFVSPEARIEPGVFVGAGAMINCGAVIRSHAIINTGSIIEHDCQIGSYAHIGPGVVLSGGVNVGAETLVGVGSTVIQEKSIAERCVVGAGSVVIRDLIDANSLYVGSPAQRKKGLVI